MLSRGRQTCVDVFDTLPIFLKNFLESENLVCSAMAGTKTALGIIQLWFNYFATSFFNALGSVNVNSLKIPKKHRGSHKMPSRATCGQRATCLRPRVYRLLPLVSLGLSHVSFLFHFN